jgi:signal peptidase I
MLRARSCVVFLILAFGMTACARPVVFEGTSMLPSIKDGDRLLIDQNTDQIKRGDIIQFKYPKDRSKFYLKRVIALPNEIVEIRQGSVYVNGEKLIEDYVDPKYDTLTDDFPEQKIGANEFYVLGDNRDNSSDSRYWGTVKKELVMGKYYSTYSSAK